MKNPTGFFKPVGLMNKGDPAGFKGRSELHHQNLLLQRKSNLDCHLPLRDPAFLN
jgi:hypothetical protein